MFYDTQSEQAVLGGLIKYGKDAHADVHGILNDDCFHDEFNQTLYKICNDVLSKSEKIDLASIGISSRNLNIKLNKNEQELIKKLFNYPVELENVRRFAQKLRKLEIAEKLYFEVDQAKDKVSLVTGEEKLDDILKIVEEPLYQFCHNVGISQENEAEHLNIGLSDYLTDLENNPVDQLGTPTGFLYLDRALGGGIIPGGFALIGARQKVGKTTLADQIALNSSIIYNVPTLMLDTEMFKKKHWYRIISNLTEINVDTIRTGQYAKDPYMLNKVRQAQQLIESSNYYYKNVAGKSFSEILGIARRWLYKEVGLDDNGFTKPALIVLDYFKLSKGDSGESKKEYELIGYQAGELSDFCIKYNLPAIAFVQLNRQGIDKESEDVISQSDRLGWSCTSFTIFKKKSKEEVQEDGLHMGNRKLIPLFTRDGEPIDEGDYINVKFEGEYAKVTELGTKSQFNTQTQSI